MLMNYMGRQSVDERASLVQITVVYATAGNQTEIELEVQKGCSLLKAIQLSGILDLFPHIDLAETAVGIFGRLMPLETSLQEGDRIEIYRLLHKHPRQARYLRAKKIVKTG